MPRTTKERIEELECQRVTLEGELEAANRKLGRARTALQRIRGFCSASIFGARRHKIVGYADDGLAN